MSWERELNEDKNYTAMDGRKGEARVKGKVLERSWAQEGEARCQGRPNSI